MASSNNNPGWLFKRIGIGLALAGLAVVAANCHVLVPRQGWSKKWGPLVPHSTFPGDCNLCHVPESWDKLKGDFSFNHEKETGYPLLAAHANAACLRCHNDRGPVQAYVARGCGGCHADPHQGTLGLTCQTCHQEQNWRPVGLVAEHARTRFPLAGPHAVTPCESCHVQAPVGIYVGAPLQCEHCHQRDLARATSPDHQANGWMVTCERCHSQTGWDKAYFDHPSFPLTGAHRGLDCVRCHTSGTFGSIPSDCYACHQDDYERAPNHLVSNFARDCTQCHSTSGWAAAFDHRFFPLTGGHRGLDCYQCHTAGTLGPIPKDCNACHQDDYQRAPNHVALGFPTDCARCHSASGWAASLSHRFPLRGPHNVSCASCHQSGTTTTYICLTCHEHAQSTMDEKHRQVGGYSYSSASCYQCHPNGTH